MEAYPFVDGGTASSMHQDQCLPGFIDPRQTERPDAHLHGLSISTSNAATLDNVVTPQEYMIDSDSRKAALLPPFNPSSLTKSGPSSVSSYGSSAGCLTPATTDGSFSRCRSLFSPGAQLYCVIPNASSPSIRSRKARGGESGGLGHDYFEPLTSPNPIVYSNESSFSTDTDSRNSISPYNVSFQDHNEDQQTMWLDDGGCQSIPTACERAMHTDQSASLGRDLVSRFNLSLSSQVDDHSQEYMHMPQNSFGDFLVNETAMMRSTINREYEQIPTLGTSFDCFAPCPISDDDLLDINRPSHFLKNESPQSPMRHPHRRSWARRKTSTNYTDSTDPFTIPPRKIMTRISKSSKRQSIMVADSSKKPHDCEDCDLRFQRPEHLKRHRGSVHALAPLWFPCLVPTCFEKDKVTRKRIKARGDNVTMHYRNTHFKQGNSENSGKNDRVSMKDAYLLSLTTSPKTFDLLKLDFRFDRLFSGKISIDIDEDKHCGQWKMLGWSIKETRDLNVRDLFRDTVYDTRVREQFFQSWHDYDNAMMKHFDFRWHKMIDGTLTYEAAMTTAKHFIKDRRLGLLGVSMQETEEMGMAHMDPRWIKMRRGEMSIEDSDELGVKEVNPVYIARIEKRRR